MTDPAAQRLISGEAWDDFCENLRRTGHVIDEFGEGVDDLDRAEWYRCLTRYVRGGLERYLEAGEPARPQLRDLAWRHTINFASPMQDHLFAEFPDASGTYRISGNRGSVEYFVIASWSSPQPPDPGARNWAELGMDGLKEFDPALLNTRTTLESGDMTFSPAGDFSFIVSQQRPSDGEDWLPITPDCTGLIVRWVLASRDGLVSPSMKIERLDCRDPEPVSAAHVSNGLAKAAQATLGYATLIRNWWTDNLAKRPNTIVFSQAVYLSNGGVADNRYHGFGSWVRDQDEALVVRFVPTPCAYWTFQICNIWQENLDNYQDGQGYLYKHGARLEEDGSVLIILAEEDPAVGGNWIDPYGHRHGGWSFRLVKVDGPPPAISVHRVRLSSLKSQGLSALSTIQSINSGGMTD
ncbi:hypothetical protein [Sphingobium subterraneum]|uniref:DUF1214 domain-containing protein n=1 Tax=Sphingobium subterraneum TaxID=627688 RepID=A0A841J3G4_9SPHN|nr:hypothetical protein [Sphingobium subterraneum]MBB6125324.1 hypothetical protein [Sphingobium subterraneum]